MKFRILLGSALLALSAPAAAEMSDGEIRIGFLTDFASVYAQSAGQGSLIAAEMAVEEFGGEVRGAPIHIIPVDHKLDRDIALKEAERLRTEHNVDAFAEMVGTQVAVPLQKYAKEHNIVALHTGTASSTLTNEHCSPVGVHWAYDTYALAAGTARAMTRRGGKNWYFVTVDYPFGHVLERDATAVVEVEGGKKLGTTTHPFRSVDLSPALLDAASSGANVVGLANAGGDGRTAIRQAYEYGMLNNPDQDVVALLTAINNIQALGLYVANGLIWTTGFYWDFDDKTRQWSQEFYNRHGAMPNMLQAGTYSAVLHYLKAIEAAGTDKPESVIAKMREIPVEDVFARNGYLRADGRMVHDMYLVKVKKPSESKRAWDYLDILDVIPGKEAYRPLNQSECKSL